MLYYVDSDKGKKKVIESKALELNSQGHNIYIYPDVTDQVILWRGHGVQKYKGTIPYYHIGEYVAVFFNIDGLQFKSLTGNTSSLRRFSYFLDKIFGRRYNKGYIPIGKIRQGTTQLKEVMVRSADDVITSFQKTKKIGKLDLKYLQNVATALNMEVSSSSYEDKEQIEQINNSVPITKVIEMFSVKGGIVDEENNRYISDKKTDRPLCGKPFELAYKLNKRNFDETMMLFSDGVRVEKKKDNKIIELKEGKYIIFGKDNVMHKEEVETDAGIQTKAKEIFEFPVFCEGFADTAYDLANKRMMDFEQRFYVVNAKGKTMYIGKEVDRKSFNKRYLKDGLSYRGGELQLLDLYDSFDKLIEYGDVKEVKVLPYNGFYPDNGVRIHGGGIFKSVSSDTIKSVALEYPLGSSKPQITLKEAHDKFCSLSKKTQMMSVLFLWFCGAMAKQVFDDINIRIPIIIASGKSGSGKTNAIQTLQLLWGFGNNTGDNVRRISLEGTTQQPILKAATDYSPLFMDEFTGEVSRNVEEIFRSFYESSTVSKGRQFGNEAFKLNSPLIIGGESMPTYQSIINRSILTIFEIGDPIINETTIYELHDAIVCDDWRDKFILSDVDEGYITNEYKKLEGMKIAEFARMDHSARFIILINRMLKLNDEDVIIEELKRLSKEQNRFLSSSDEMKNLIFELLHSASISKLMMTDLRGGQLLLSLPTQGIRQPERKRRVLLELQEKFSPDNKKKDISLIVFDMSKVGEYDRDLYNSMIHYLCMRDSNLESELGMVEKNNLSLTDF